MCSVYIFFQRALLSFFPMEIKAYYEFLYQVHRFVVSGENASRKLKNSDFIRGRLAEKPFNWKIWFETDFCAGGFYYSA